MAGAVFDGRPIRFGNRRLVYFCAQPTYRSDTHLFVGLMDVTEASPSVLPVPVIVPDVEIRGIDIPTFAVVNDEVIGLYFDDHGPDSTGIGTDTDVVLCRSTDGETFTKSFIAKPFAGQPFDRIGLPWLLVDGDAVYVYLRCKKGGAVYLARSRLDIGALTLSRPEIVAKFLRNPINIAVTKRPAGYILFYGSTVGGGVYASTSKDGGRFDLDEETMLVGQDGHEWGWDFSKIAASPDNLTDDHVGIVYTCHTPKGLCLATASFPSQEITSAHPS